MNYKECKLAEGIWCCHNGVEMLLDIIIEPKRMENPFPLSIEKVIELRDYLTKYIESMKGVTK